MRRIVGPVPLRCMAMVAGIAAAGTCANLALAAKTQTLQPGQQLHILGTRVYCGAKSQSTGVLTTCLNVKTGTQTPEGYSVGIDDEIAGASQFKGLSAPAVFVRRQPAGDGKASPAATASSGTLTANVGDKILVGGTNVVLGWRIGGLKKVVIK